MDIKFIIAMVMALGVVFLLIYELNNIRSKIEKKINGIDQIMEKHNEDIKTIFKKETTKITDRYITHTNEMVQQMRKMNSIERQTVMMSDHFVEGDYEVEYEHDVDERCDQIPYLSDMNRLNCGQTDGVNCQAQCVKKIHTRDDSGMYMSATSGTNGVFIIKDDKNNILQSTKVVDTPKNKFENPRTKTKNGAPGTTGVRSAKANLLTVPRSSPVHRLPPCVPEIVPKDSDFLDTVKAICSDQRFELPDQRFELHGQSNESIFRFIAYF